MSFNNRSDDHVSLADDTGRTVRLTIELNVTQVKVIHINKTQKCSGNLLAGEY